MHSFVSLNAFIHRGERIKEGIVLDVRDEDLIHEISLGKTANGRYVSGLLNHCDPANDATADRIFALESENLPKPKEDVKAPTDNEVKAEIESIRIELGKLGKTFHHKWGLPKLKEELAKAKQEG